MAARNPAPGPKALEALRKRLANKSKQVEVEHLLPLAKRCSAVDAQAIEELAIQQGWGRTTGEGFEPTGNWSGSGSIEMAAIFGRWTVVICTFLREGLDGVVALACDPPISLATLRTFAVGLLYSLRSPEAVAAAARIIRFHLGALSKAPPKDRGWGDERETLAKAVHAANLLLFPKTGVVITKEVEEELREALHAILAVPLLTENELSGVYCALRWVGNEESLELIAQRPLLEAPWEGIEKSVRTQIRKRARSQVKRDA